MGYAPLFFSFKAYYIAMSSNGKTTDFGSVNAGSIPAVVTNKITKHNIMDNLKISIENVSFSVNKKQDTICKVIYKPSPFLSKTTFHAKAKLHEGDTYDKKMGERIAFAKAERKAYKHARKRVKKDIAEIENILNAVKSFFDKVDDCFVHNDEYIKQLCGC